MNKPTREYCTFYIVRHGETEWNVKGLIQGHTDVPLNKNGEEQAKLLGNDIRHENFDAIYSSDLLRAKRTAEILALERKVVVETTRVLRERFYGKFEGVPNEVVDKLRNEIAHLTEAEKAAYKFSDDYESDDEIFSRFIIFLRELSLAYLNKKILIVTHGGMMRFFLIKLGFATREQLVYRGITNGAYIKLLSDGVDFFIEKTNGITLK